MRKTLTGVKDFYLAGQWVQPGGSLPVVAMSGRNVRQMISHRAGIPFQTEALPLQKGDFFQRICKHSGGLIFVYLGVKSA
jgi:hypothetical protein